MNVFPGNGIFWDRRLPFKSHQNYRPLPHFIQEYNPAAQAIWSGQKKKNTSAYYSWLNNLLHQKVYIYRLFNLYSEDHAVILHLITFL